MTYFDKRFIEFATQNTDNGEINTGFHDSKTGEWYYTKDSENAKKICELLNELYDENDILKQKLKTKYIVNKQYEELQKVKKENEQLKQQIKHSQKRTAIISGWLHDEGNLTLDKYEEILDYCYQEYKKG